MLMSTASTADPPAGYAFRAFDEGLSAARESSKPLFVYFGRFGCGYCDYTNKTAFIRPEVKQRYSAHYELVYVDAESGRRLTLPSGERITERELGTRFNAFVTPVFLFTTPDGTPILRQVGVQTAEQLLSYDRFVHEGHYRGTSYEEFTTGNE